MFLHIINSTPSDTTLVSLPGSLEPREHKHNRHHRLLKPGVNMASNIRGIYREKKTSLCTPLLTLGSFAVDKGRVGVRGAMRWVGFWYDGKGYVYLLLPSSPSSEWPQYHRQLSLHCARKDTHLGHFAEIFIQLIYWSSLLRVARGFDGVPMFQLVSQKGFHPIPSLLHLPLPSLHPVFFQS